MSCSVHAHMTGWSQVHWCCMIEFESNRFKYGDWVACCHLCSSSEVTSQDEPSFWWPFRGEEILLNHDQLNICWLPCGDWFLFSFIICSFYVFMFPRKFWYLDFSTFIVSFCCGVFCKSSSSFDFYFSASTEKYWSSVPQSRWGSRIVWLVPSKIGPNGTSRRTLTHGSIFFSKCLCKSCWDH